MNPILPSQSSLMRPQQISFQSTPVESRLENLETATAALSMKTDRIENKIDTIATSLKDVALSIEALQANFMSRPANGRTAPLDVSEFNSPLDLVIEDNKNEVDALLISASVQDRPDLAAFGKKYLNNTKFLAAVKNSSDIVSALDYFKQKETDVLADFFNATSYSGLTNQYEENYIKNAQIITPENGLLDKIYDSIAKFVGDGYGLDKDVPNKREALLTVVDKNRDKITQGYVYESDGINAFLGGLIGVAQKEIKAVSEKDPESLPFLKAPMDEYFDLYREHIEKENSKKKGGFFRR